MPPLGQCLPPPPLVEARSLLSDWEPPSVRPVFPITARVPPGPPSPATPGFSKQAQAQLGRGTTPTMHVPPPLPTPGPGNAAERVPPGGCLRVQALLPNRRCYQPVASYSIGVGTHLPQSQSGPLPGAVTAWGHLGHPAFSQPWDQPRSTALGCDTSAPPSVSRSLTTNQAEGPRGIKASERSCLPGA